MIERRPFAELGSFRNEWLNTRYHFSFADYYNPNRMGLGRLRVWNDDEIAPGTGFDPHPHREMEIITYVRSGAITHRDSLGNEGRTEAGDVQVMHAGRGIVHAEYNLEPVPTRLFQIWIYPTRRGVDPGWGSRRFPKLGSGLSVLASGREEHIKAGALPIYTEAALRAGTLAQGERIHHPMPAGARAYLVPASGALLVNGTVIGAGDGAVIAEEAELLLEAKEPTEVVMVELWD